MGGLAIVLTERRLAAALIGNWIAVPGSSMTNSV
jgi:hypothetical protein